MLGFMAECIHSTNTANAPTNGSNSKQGRFRNAVSMFFGFSFIHIHSKKANKIDDDKVYHQEDNQIHKHILSTKKEVVTSELEVTAPFICAFTLFICFL